MKEKNEKIDYEKELNPEQYEAVRTTEGPLLILAVAGSGKTRTLVYRVAYLIEHGVMPQQILLLTFTNKAADEMKNRAAKLLDNRCSSITACTYHSFCERMLRRYASVLNLQNFSIITGSDQESAVKIAANQIDLLPNELPKVKRIIAVISSAVNCNKSIHETLQKQDFEREAVYEDAIKKVDEQYKKYKAAHHLIDYDDMLTLFLKLLQQNTIIAKQISDRYKYIMVDEYQDSNDVQEQILLELRKDNHNLAVVGDDLQSLYGFRGANVQNIIDFPNKLPDCKVITLFRNYRSNQEILDFANAVVENHATEGIKKAMVGTHHSSFKPVVVTVNNPSEEARYIFRVIQYMHAQGKKYSDIAVLSRMASSSQSLEILLNKGGIPFAKYGGLKFTDRSYVKDIMAIWKCIVNPKDELSWYRVLHLFPGIDDKYAQVIAQGAEQYEANLLINHPYKTYKLANALKDFLPIYYEWQKTPFSKILSTTIQWYKNQQLSSIDSQQNPVQKEQIMKQIGELKVFLDLSSQYTTLSSFVDAFCLESPDINGKEDDKVVVSTIHSAKGLEFDTVFILDCVEGVFPRIPVLDDGTKENEELRCMYVAMTRAKEHLAVMVPKSHFMVYSKHCLPSRFLEGTRETFTLKNECKRRR